MRTVHKFRLIPGNEDVIRVSPDAQITLIAEQFGDLQMWIELDPHCSDEKLVERHFRVFDTGQLIDDFADLHIWHVGSAICAGGQLIRHVYEVKPT